MKIIDLIKIRYGCVFIYGYTMGDPNRAQEDDEEK